MFFSRDDGQQEKIGVASDQVAKRVFLPVLEEENVLIG